MISTSKKDIFWSYLGLFLNVGTNLIVLPFILKFLSSTELGLWYTFASIGGIVNLLDFGFSPTLVRNVSYAWGGAKELKKVGLGSDIGTKEPNYKLFRNIILVTKKIYLLISFGALLILFTAGTFYILSITKDFSGSNHLIAWGIFCVGIFINLYYSYWTPLLRGIGAIKEGQKATIYARIVQIVFTILGLLLEFNLIAVAGSFLLSGFVSRYISKYFFIKKIDVKRLDLDFERKSEKNDGEIKKTFYIIWHNASRIGLVSLGSFLITQSSTLLCSSFFGLDTTAKYGITLQLFSILVSLSSTLYSIYLPELNQAYLFNNSEKIRQIISVTTFTNWIIYFSGAVFIILFGHQVLSFIGSSINLLPAKLTIFMAVYLFLENNHSMFATFITSENRVPFIKASLLSGVSIVVLSIVLSSKTELGLWSLLLSQAVVQLCYNNWRWPMEVLNKQKLNITKIPRYFISYIRANGQFVPR